MLPADGADSPAGRESAPPRAPTIAPMLDTPATTMPTTLGTASPSPGVHPPGGSGPASTTPATPSSANPVPPTPSAPTPGSLCPAKAGAGAGVVWLLLVGLFLLALGLRWQVYAETMADPLGHTRPFRMVGVPTSDARGRDHQAESILDGAGLFDYWIGLRPGMSVLLAIIYFWTGPSSAVATWVNLLIGAAAPPLAMLVGMRASGRLLAPAAAAAALALDPALCAMSGDIITEPAGLLLLLGAMLLLIDGMRHDKTRLLVWSGVFLAASNLVRPATVLVLPIWAIVVAIRLRQGGWPDPGVPDAQAVASRPRRGGWRRGTVAGGAIIAGFVLLMGPWLIRQRVVIGEWTPSSNSADLLYAATSPRHRMWPGQIQLDADRAGVPREPVARMCFFQAGILDHLRQHGRWYAGHVARASWRSAVELVDWLPRQLARWMLGGLLGAGVFVTAFSRRRRLGVWGLSMGLGGMAVGWWLIANFPTSLTIGSAAALGLAFLFRRDWAIACLLAATFAATVLSIGLLGGVEAERVGVVVSWIPILLAAVAAHAIGGFLVVGEGWGSSIGIPPPSPRPLLPLMAKRGLLAIAIVAIAVPSAVMLYRLYISPISPRGGPLARTDPLAARIAAEALHRLTATPAGESLPVGDWHRDLRVERGRISRFLYPLAANGGIAMASAQFHWRP